MLDVRSKSMIKVQRPVVPVNTKLDAWLWGSERPQPRDELPKYDVGGLIVIITVASTRLELPQTGLRAARYRRPRSLNNQHQNLPLQSRSS
jgi:hypothetical protein